MNPKALGNKKTRVEGFRTIRDFARQTRETILNEGRAPSIVVDGKVDDDMVVTGPSRCGLRERQGMRGEIRIDKSLTSDFTLIVKHNALFAALLAELGTAFDCVGLVRNPLAVLASWQTVELPVHHGRIPAGEQFDSALQGSLRSEPDVLRRQITILNWFFDSYRAHLGPSKIIRYEDLVSSGGSVLFGLVGRGRAPPVPLENRNSSPTYREVEPELLMDALFETGGAWMDFYALADCKHVADTICARR